MHKMKLPLQSFYDLCMKRWLFRDEEDKANLYFIKTFYILLGFLFWDLLGKNIYVETCWMYSIFIGIFSLCININNETKGRLKE